MKCYDPRLAFVNLSGGTPIFTRYRWSHFINVRNGYRSPKFPKRPPGAGDPLKMPCQDCEACFLEQARQRAVRCSHEMKSNDGVGSFLTLTYRKESLPPGGQLVYSHPEKFVKRLRRAICEMDHCYGSRFDWKKLRMRRGCRGLCRKIRTFGCAEYGDRGLRPHYHILIFGFDFPDATYWRGGSEHGSGHVAYRSKMLEETWTYGHSEIGTLTFESASYVARYVQKKKFKKRIPEDFPKERSVCISRRPGIGRTFFEKHYHDWYAIDAVVVNGRKQGIPRYYDKLLEEREPELYQRVKLDRQAKRPIEEYDNSHERMPVRKSVHQASLKQLRRSYEE
jgi:hypothetical protein